MGVSYDRLWKMLIDKNMKRIEMQYLTGISGNILARMGKNQYVSMETIEKICKKLDCTVDEMMEFTMISLQERLQMMQQTLPLLLTLPGLSGQSAIRKQTISASNSCCQIN